MYPNQGNFCDCPEYNEMNIMDQFKNDRFIQPINYLQTQNNMYFVFPFMNNLFSYQEKKKLSKVEIVKVFLECCLAVQTLHKHGLVHRNLTPKAFFIQEDKVVLGKFLRSVANESTASGFPEMNKFYTAPENLGETQVFNTKSDIFSLGVILYEMFFHIYPFSDAQIKNYTQLRESGTLNIFIPDSTVISEETTTLLKNMLSFEPENRTELGQIIGKLNEIILNLENKNQNFKSYSNTMQLLFKKIEFLNQFGEQLKKRYYDIETAVFYHFLLVKKIYLTIQSFSKYLQFELSEKDGEEVEKTLRFLINVQDKSRTQIQSFIKVLREKTTSVFLKVIEPELNVEEDFKDFNMLKKYIIFPFD